MDHSQMNMDMEESSPCDDCISAAEHNVLKDTQIYNSEIPIIVSASFPSNLDTIEIDQNPNNLPLFVREGPSLRGPPLVGTVILRT